MNNHSRRRRNSGSGRGSGGKKISPIGAAAALVVCAVLLIGLYFGLHVLENKMSSTASTDDEDGYEQSADIQFFFSRGDYNIDDDYEGDDYDYEEYISMDAVETYLIMGTDSKGRTFDEETEAVIAETTGEEESASEGDETEIVVGDPADFMMLLVIDRTKDTYGYLQLDRNTMTWVILLTDDGGDGASGYEQLCLAHCYGITPEMNCENTVNTISLMLGEVPINGYYCMDMAGIGELNALVGGVDVTLNEDFTDKDPEMKKGATLHLNDTQAEIYVRGRYGLTDETNVARMERQRDYLNKFLEKAQAKFDADSSFATDAYAQLADHVTTNMPGSNVSKLANKLSGCECLGILTIDGTTEIKVSETDGIAHEQFTINYDSLIDVMTQLYNMEPYDEAAYGDDEDESEYIVGDDYEDESDTEYY